MRGDLQVFETVAQTMTEAGFIAGTQFFGYKEFL